MSLQVWLPLNGHLNNQGLENITVSSHTAILNTSGKLGNCYEFNGSQYLALPKTILPSKTPNWSFACWFYLANVTSSSAACLFSERTGTNPYGYTIFLYPNTSNMLVDDGARWQVKPTTFSAQTWYHLVVTRTPSNKSIYINGQLMSTTSTIGNTSSVNSNGCLIGLAQSSSALITGDQGFIGKLNDVRIYDHALSAKEIKEISKGLVVHYPLDNNGQGDDSTYTDTTVYDTSGYGNDGKNQYITYETDTPRYSVSSVLSGSSTRITNTTINIGNEWSYGLWFKSAAAARSWEGLVILNNNGGDSDIQLGFYTYPNNSRIQTTANGQYNTISHTYDDKWHHLFATFDGTTLKTYRDGELVDTKTITNSLLSRSNLTFGARRRGEVTFDCPYKGSLSDFRLYATVLSEDDIKELYSSSISIDNNGNIYSYEFIEET